MENNKTEDRTDNCQSSGAVVICHCSDCGKTERKEPLQRGFTQGELKVYKKYCEDCIERIATETLCGIIGKLDGR